MKLNRADTPVRDFEDCEYDAGAESLRKCIKSCPTDNIYGKASALARQ